MPTVWIPSLMQKLTGGQTQVEAEGNTVREVIENLDRAFPGCRARLCEDDHIRADIAVSVDGEIGVEGMRQQVGAESEIHFLPALSGG